MVLRYLAAALNVLPLAEMNLAGRPLLAENLFQTSNEGLSRLVKYDVKVYSSRDITSEKTNPNFLSDIIATKYIKWASKINTCVCKSWILLNSTGRK